MGLPRAVFAGRLLYRKRDAESIPGPDGIDKGGDDEAKETDRKERKEKRSEEAPSALLGSPVRRYVPSGSGSRLGFLSFWNTEDLSAAGTSGLLALPFLFGLQTLAALGAVDSHSALHKLSDALERMVSELQLLKGIIRLEFWRARLAAFLRRLRNPGSGWPYPRTSFLEGVALRDSCGCSFRRTRPVTPFLLWKPVFSARIRPWVKAWRDSQKPEERRKEGTRARVLPEVVHPR